jgi:hypothetical protein
MVTVDIRKDAPLIKSTEINGANHLISGSDYTSHKFASTWRKPKVESKNAARSESRSGCQMWSRLDASQGGKLYEWNSVGNLDDPLKSSTVSL